MVKLDELNGLISKFSQMRALISKIKRIDSLGSTVQVEHPITKEMVDLPIPLDEKQKALDKLIVLKGEASGLIQTIDWSKIE